jgi:hypothetical protein
VKGFVKWLNHVSGNDIEGMIKKQAKVFVQLNEAKTEKEYQNAAESIAKMIKGL